MGPCAAGKTTLIAGLTRLGVNARHIAQEHSYVQDMWRRISNPRWLVYLDVSYSVATQRKHLDWTEAEYLEQIRRLAHAQRHADLVIPTDEFTQQQVLERVLTFLREKGLGSG
ncbi:MAG: hypothetical protein PHS96_11695 [Anaerolineales bacterium]|nr:hypothetical protein [Anaerolineales bacterium]